MSEERNDSLEVTLRLPADGMTQLAQLLAALLGGGQTAKEEGREQIENPAFDMERFRELTDAPPLRMEQNVMDLPEAVQRGEISFADIPGVPAADRTVREIASPRPFLYEVSGGPVLPTAETDSAELLQRAAGRDAAATDPESLSHRWERDARRYDGGFHIY